MRRVQDYLKELNREKLIETYLDYNPDVLEGPINQEDYTGIRLKKMKYREVDKFIQRLINMDVTEIENGKTYILMAYPGQVTNTEVVDVEYSLVCKEDLSSEDEKVPTHDFHTSPQSEMIGLYVAETPYTQRNIYDLIAQVLCAASFYGFQQERIYQENREFTDPFGIWYKDPDGYNEALEARSLDNLPDKHTQPFDITQIKLWLEVRETLKKYMTYCYERELSMLRKSLIFEEKIGDGINRRMLCGAVKCEEGGRLSVNDLLLQIQRLDESFGVEDIGELYISCMDKESEISQKLKTLEIYNGIAEEISDEGPAYISKEFLEEYFKVNEELAIEEGSEFIIYHEASRHDEYNYAVGSYHITYMH